MTAVVIGANELLHPLWPETSQEGYKWWRKQGPAHSRLQIGLNYNLGLGSVGSGCVTQACDSSDNGTAATACTHIAQVALFVNSKQLGFNFVFHVCHRLYRVINVD